MRRLLAAVVLLCAPLTPLAPPAARADKVDDKVARKVEAKRIAKQDLDALLAATDDIAAKVSALRGLPVKKPIARGVMSKDQVLERLILRLDEDYSAGELAEEARAVKRLGLLPADADYRQMVLDLLTDQIAGFYDPKVKELYIADWIEPSLQKITMAHEIDHALQDQSFDLGRLITPIKDNADEQLARQALVEGDGVGAMLEWYLRDLGLKTDPWAGDVAGAMKQMAAMGMGSLGTAPLFLQESLLFPYVGGAGLIAETRKLKPWSAVDAMYQRLPASTEQVIHPDKYAAGERAVAVKAAALPTLKGWKPVYQNVLGELMWSVLLRQHGVPRKRADTAAAGWGGDRYAVYAPPGDDGKGVAGLVLVSLSTWDSEAEAIEAFAAASEAVPGMTGGVTDCEIAPAALFNSCGDAQAETSIERKGDRVLLVVAAPAASAAKLRSDVWAKWKVGGVAKPAPAKAAPARKPAR